MAMGERMIVIAPAQSQPAAAKAKPPIDILSLQANHSPLDAGGTYGILPLDAGLQVSTGRLMDWRQSGQVSPSKSVCLGVGQGTGVGHTHTLCLHN